MDSAEPATPYTSESQDPNALFWEYQRTKDVTLRNEIVLQYKHIIKYVAFCLRESYKNYADTEDIVNQGILALIDAVERFDPSMGVKFESFASIKVRGAIIDYIRKQDWIPRRVRKLAAEINTAYNQLAHRLKREPTHPEIAAALGISEKALDKAFQEASNAMMLSFEQELYENANISSFVAAPVDDRYFHGSSQAEAPLYREEYRQQLQAAIAGLKEKEQLVISLYYYEGLKFHEIAKVLQVSESRVCQIHSKALLKMRSQLQAYTEA